ncbi:MAG: hypothetical protein JNM93_07645 [Bacteriovoracaceae bacterium]|nr:hypothetical protein [Bacteriovoracaceae bacterium]
MRYHDLIEKVATYGYGVFTLTMVQDEAEKASLTKFIQRNPSLFQQFKGKQGDLKIITLTSEGKNHFGIKVRLSEAQSWHSYLDIALFNSYMAEIGEWAKQTNRPHFVLDLKKEKVGLISARWGINKHFHDLKTILATENQKKQLSNDLSFIADSVRDLRASKEEIIETISRAYTPKAFQHIRNI